MTKNRPRLDGPMPSYANDTLNACKYTVYV